MENINTKKSLAPELQKVSICSVRIFAYLKVIDKKEWTPYLSLAQVADILRELSAESEPERKRPPPSTHDHNEDKKRYTKK